MQSAASRSLRNAPEANFDNAMFYMNDHSVRKWEAVTRDILGESFARGASSMRLVLWGFNRTRSLSSTHLRPAKGVRADNLPEGARRNHTVMLSKLS